MPGAVHRNHMALLIFPYIDKVVGTLLPIRVTAIDADNVIHKRQVLPRVPAALGAEHRVSADDIRRGRETLDEQIVRVHFDGEDVDNEHIGKTAGVLVGEWRRGVVRERGRTDRVEIGLALCQATLCSCRRSLRLA